MYLFINGLVWKKDFTTFISYLHILYLYLHILTLGGWVCNLMSLWYKDFICNGPLVISKQGRFKNKSKFIKVLNKHAALKKKIFS